ncbi:MAG: class E sortase [Streptosporangiaceae bacterium]
MRTFVRGLGELLITFGVVVVLFAAYELWGTGLYTQRQQHSLQHTLQRRWTKPAPDRPRLAHVPFGQGFAIIWMPRFGRDYHYAIVQGVGVEDLKKGPGHYPGTAMPGRVGNFVVSGHRTTYLAPFNRINELHKGDAIIIETRSTWYTYRVDDEDVVDPTDIKVVAPVPYHPAKKPTRRLITLTTCNPKYSAATRLIVFGRLAGKRPKSEGPPTVLAKAKA